MKLLENNYNKGKWRVTDVKLQDLFGNYKKKTVYTIVMSTGVVWGILTILALHISIDPQMNISSNVLTIVSPASSQVPFFGLGSCP